MHSTRHERRGVFLYPSGEVYVGQWATDSAARAHAQSRPAQIAPGDARSAGRSSASGSGPVGRRGKKVNPPSPASESPPSTPTSSDSGRAPQRASADGRRGNVTVLAGDVAPCREGWGVHLRGHEKYEGEWRHDCWHGVGGIIVKGGDRYFGQFVEGSRVGTGVSVSQRGVLYAESWVAGRLVRRRPLLRGDSAPSGPKTHQRMSSGSSMRAGGSVGSGGLSRLSSPTRDPSWSRSASSSPSRHSSQEPPRDCGSQTASPERGPAQPRRPPSLTPAPLSPAQLGGADADAPKHDKADEERSSLRYMSLWTPHEVARLVRKLGLGVASAAKLRAHHVGGAALGTFTSQSAAPFLRTVFEEEGSGRAGADRSAGSCASKKLLVIAVRLFLSVRRKMSELNVSPAELREEFHDTEIDESKLVYGDMIGEGGYGCVYRARWMHTDVAAKFFRAREGQVSPDFYQELTVLRRLRHPNVTLLIGFCFRGQYVVVTELVRRGNLYELLHRQRHLPGFGEDWTFSHVVDIAREICLGMVYLHANEVVHRDLKSSNVLLSGARQVKLCDFGLAHLLSDSTPRVGVVGTHNWMAPEVLRGEEYTKAADVYSFGMILWEMTSRKVPFQRYSFVQVVGLVGYGRRRPRLPQGCPEPLRELLQRVLRPRQQSRRSFQELSEDFRKIHQSAVIDVEESLWTFLTG